MFKNILSFVLSTLLVAQVCRAAPEDAAEEALMGLRDAITKTLNSAFDVHSKLADEIEAASLAAKDAQDSDEVAKCVQMVADEALTNIYTRSVTLVDLAMTISYNEEREIIKCSRASESCLSDLADTIQTVTKEIAPMAERQLNTDSATVEKQIAQIKACAQSA